MSEPCVNSTPETSRAAAVPAQVRSSAWISSRRRLAWFAAATVLLLGLFARPLAQWVSYAAQSELYSHVPLVPFLCAYFIWSRRKELALDSRPRPALAVAPLALGVGVWTACGLALNQGWKPAAEDYFAAMTCSWVLLFYGACAVFLGDATLRVAGFGLALLVFTIPFPVAAREFIQALLQRGSAEAAAMMFQLSGMPVFRQGLHFQLPGFSMEVAPQCSGIHSSLALLISSLLAAEVLLRRGWARALLVVSVIPLAMLRNGFRIFVLGELCVKVNPDIIHSALHKRGGPIFFALSLIPFFLLLLLLRKLESRNAPSIRIQPKD